MWCTSPRVRRAIELPQIRCLRLFFAPKTIWRRGILRLFLSLHRLLILPIRRILRQLRSSNMSSVFEF